MLVYYDRESYGEISFSSTPTSGTGGRSEDGPGVYPGDLCTISLESGNISYNRVQYMCYSQFNHL